MAVSMPFASAKEIFAELVNMPNVESTFISGSIVTPGSNYVPVIPPSNVNVIIDTKNFSEMYIYSCYSVESTNKALEIIRDYLKKNKEMKTVLRTSTSQQAYSIYRQDDSNGNKIRLIIWNSYAPNNCQVVVIEWEEDNSMTGDDMLEKYAFPLRLPDKEIIISTLSQLDCFDDDSIFGDDSMGYLIY